MPTKDISSANLPLSQAHWIWPRNEHWDLQNCYALFRKRFRLEKVPDQAPLFITADASYQLYINGHYVCRGPARGFQASWPYDEVDVRPWLKKGSNLMAVRVHHPGHGTFQYVSHDYAGLLVAATWADPILVSDASWSCRRQTGVRRDTVPVSVQLSHQEAIDLREEDPDWMMPGYREDDRWKEKVYTRPWNALPWYALESRGIPMLREEEMALGEVIGTARGKSAPDHLTARDLSQLRFREGLAHRPAKEQGPSLAFPASRRGHWQSRLLDMGKLHIGSVILDIPEARGSEIVETHHYETIDAATLTPDFALDFNCRIAFSHRLTCRPGANRHAFYHPFGFRYMVVTVRDNTGPLTVTPTLRTSVYPLRQAGSFASSDAALDAIWQTCAWTQRVCSLDAYVDTPWREQAQWWGDARVQSWNTFHLDGDTRLLRRGIRQIASQVTPDGVTYGHAPTIAHNCILPDFTLIWMLTLWDHYWQTGSLEAFRAHEPVAAKALTYFEKWTDPATGLLRYDPRFWLFLDWTGLRKEGCSSVYSLWLQEALHKLETLYRLARRPKESAACARWATKLRRSLRRLLNAQGLLRDGYTPEGKMDPGTSVHAQTLALMTGLAPEHEQAMITRRLLPAVKGTLPGDVKPSAYWITYIYTALAERGHGAAVVEDIRRRWQPMAEHGTTWENFEVQRGAESHSHAWSAHPLFHFMQILGGIRQAAPGWKQIIFAPTFALDRAAVTVPTPLGPVQSNWHKQDGTISGRLDLPRDMSALVKLPGQPEQTRRGPGVHTFEIATA